MQGETLSPSQAKHIVDEANGIMSRCKTEMENKNQEFVEKVSKVWEDTNAVNYFQKHKKTMEDIITYLSENNQIFAKRVEDIANKYCSAGGKGAISVSKITLSPAIDVSLIKDVFAEGANGDDFGFINPQNGAEQVMDAFTELINSLTKTATQTVSSIQSINAFGNSEVRMEIANSAGKVVDILKSNISQVDKYIRQYVNETAQAYIKVGQNAAQSAKLTTDNAQNSTSNTSSNSNQTGVGYWGENKTPVPIMTESADSIINSGTSTTANPYTTGGESGWNVEVKTESLGDTNSSGTTTQD